MIVCLSIPVHYACGEQLDRALLFAHASLLQGDNRICRQGLYAAVWHICTTCVSDVVCMHMMHSHQSTMYFVRGVMIY